MAKFLNTSASNYFLEELIKDARDRPILVSPYLKLNDWVKALLADKNRLKVDVRTGAMSPRRRTLQAHHAPGRHDE
ncbi:hypothetical protein [Luteimonas changyuni]|uniref:hypothetical protein n=1 Tax=Luteimonas sp. MJ145 TaxID=3129234 RepID=UPI0031B9BD06